MIRAWRRHGLSLTLVTALSAMMGVTLLLGPAQFRAQGMQGSYWAWWVFQTLLSLEADVFGALILVVGTRFLWERGSAEAHDPPPETDR